MDQRSLIPQITTSTPEASRRAALAKARAPRLAALAGRTAVRSASGRLLLLPTIPHRTA
jgi:hypothetical protein